MDKESHNPLKAFCEAYISQNRETWPTSEQQVAKAFVSHFEIPFVSRVEDLQDFLIHTNIELIERELPADLLGVNMSFGVKRQIFTSRNALFETHTVLHEIREIMEVDFRELGFSTTNSSDLDSRADEFSFEVDMCAAMPSIQRWIDKKMETNSTWKKLARFCIAIFIVLQFEKRSRFRAFDYRLEGPSKRSQTKHI